MEQKYLDELIADMISRAGQCLHVGDGDKSSVALFFLEGSAPEWSHAPKRYVYGGQCTLCYKKFDAPTAIRLYSFNKRHPPDWLTPVEFASEVIIPSVPKEDLRDMAKEMALRLPAQLRRDLVQALVAHDTVTSIFNETA